MLAYFYFECSWFLKKENMTVVKSPREQRSGYRFSEPPIGTFRSYSYTLDSVLRSEGWEETAGTKMT